ncbi:MAG: thiamine-phosphate kinase [Epsilonproteobacteria bacterium]|nr:thiamine-phosphate kinase [Campylobacterota bacterium]
MTNKEEFFISLVSSSTPLIGDDGAVDGEYVYTQDAFCENVHFKSSWLTYKQIAIKASLINISDVIAMNATPKYALLTLAMPKTITKSQITQLYNGFMQCAKQYNYQIIGGDTIQNDKLDITMTFISTTKKPIFRNNVKNDDIICFSGNLGNVSKDLHALFRGKKIKSTSKFITPHIRDKFMQKASRYINSALDISDGLSKELERLSKANKIGFDFKVKLNKDILCSGEEYELLFSVSRRNLAYILNIAKRTKTPITVLAIAKKGYKYKSICKENHFD